MKHAVHNVAAILWLPFTLHIKLFPMINLLYFYISTSQSMRAVPSMAVFCSSLISDFKAMLFRYFLNDFLKFRLAPIITGSTFSYIPHVLYSNVRSVYFKIFSSSFLIIFLSPKLLLLL
jgi:hypothetical protein